jgi:hypothetical protein
MTAKDLTLPGKPVHPWLHILRICQAPSLPAPSGAEAYPQHDALLSEASAGLLREFARLGHIVQRRPDAQTDILFTTARFGAVLDWREALLFNYRRRFGLRHTPAIYTLVHIKPSELQQHLARLELSLQRATPDPSEFAYPGLADRAARVLFEQGRRGGPILAFERLVQAQVKCLRILLFVGDERPEYAYHFDLVGAHPRIEAAGAGADEAFYRDLALRLAAVASTREVTQHEFTGDAIPAATWRSLTTPPAMRHAARELDRRHFFTEMAVIANLVSVPVVSGAVASQYSEGCFATWEPALAALITTATGCLRPVVKGNISDRDLTVVVGMRPDASGALVRPVEGMGEQAPSSESVEMYDMDGALPRVDLGDGRGATAPVARSKLHGHRGVGAYDPALVEFVALDEAYYHYPVNCGTAAQAEGIKAAFARSVALRDPKDPRQVAFTVLPGHGAVIVEKWVPGKAPFQLIWEYMDAGSLRIESRIPQGLHHYEPGADRMMVLRE